MNEEKDVTGMNGCVFDTVHMNERYFYSKVDFVFLRSFLQILWSSTYNKWVENAAMKGASTWTTQIVWGGLFVAERHLTVKWFKVSEIPVVSDMLLEIMKELNHSTGRQAWTCTQRLTMWL